MQMGNMGADLLEMNWVQSIVLFFSYLAWVLYCVGLVVAVFECGIEYLSSIEKSLKEQGFSVKQADKEDIKRSSLCSAKMHFIIN